MSRPPRNKNGFTLMEILVAMSLMGFLAVVTWTLFDTYRNLFESGIDRSGRTRLARALTEQLSNDLNSAIQESSVGQTVSLQTTETSSESWSVEPSRKTNQTNRSAPSQTSESTNAIDSSTDPANPADQQTTTTMTSDQNDSQEESTDTITTRRFGLFGSRHTLRLDVLQVDPHYVYRLASRASGTQDENVGSLLFEDSIGEDASSTLGQKAELRTIEYTFTPKEEEGINTQTSEKDPLAETSLATQTESTNLEPPRRPGLTRRELSFDVLPDGETDPLLANLDPESINPEESLDPNECYLPEVSDLSFRYYDGTGWTTSWDSLTRRSLPVAVEITFKIKTDRQKKKRLGEQAEDTAEEQDAEVSEDATVGADLETDEVAYIDETYENDQENLNPPKNEYRVLVTLPTSAKYTGVQAELDSPFETMPEPVAPDPLRQPTLQTPTPQTQNEKSKSDERWMRSPD